MSKSVNSAFSSSDPLKRQLPQFEDNAAIPLSAAAVQQILIDFEAAEEHIRLIALQQLLPCHMPWAGFEPLRKGLKRLQKDHSSAVRVLALQIEQEAEKIATLDALRNLQTEEEDDEEDEWKQRERKRNKPRHRRRNEDE